MSNTNQVAYDRFLRTGRGWYRTERAAQDYALAMMLELEQRRPTREDRRYRMFDRDGRPMWVSVPA
jgi:hypothetical protein